VKSPMDEIRELLKEFGELELEKVDLNVEELRLLFRPLTSFLPPQVPKLEAPAKPASLLETEFSPFVQEYPGTIAEVTLGATRAEGGTRGRVVKIGGETAPPWHFLEGKFPHPPAIACDVFDMPLRLPGPVRAVLGDAIEDPIKWAKLAVERFGADLIDIELVSSDPYSQNTPIEESCRLVENLLQAVEVPLVVGGSGNPEKDAKLLPKIAEVCEGERVLLSSANLDMWEPVAKAAKQYGHVVLAWTSIDLAQAKELNRKLYEYIPKEQIVIDPTSAPLGYGLEYAFSIMERIRLAGLMGDTELQCPMGSATANAWGAREAWLHNPEMGAREYRGPMWEAAMALAMLMAGNDLYITLHPAAIRTMKDAIRWLRGEGGEPTFSPWIGVK
jgi:acetyl-CoA decarbonylase/synthase complex subunit delta